MVNKRDLQKDLQLLEQGLYPSGIEVIEIAKRALEGAIKATERVEWLEKRLALVEESEAVISEELSRAKKELAKASWDKYPERMGR